MNNGSKLKNVTLCPTKDRHGESTWMLIHSDGWQDVFFDRYAKHLNEKIEKSLSTRERYCRFVAGFIDYLIEAAKWLEESGQNYLDGEMLIDLVEAYPRVLAGATNSASEMVAELSRRLGRTVVAEGSQRIHLAAINHYLDLSEAYNQKISQRQIDQDNGLPIFSEFSLFPQLAPQEFSTYEKIAISERSMIGGVVAGGPRIKRAAILKTVHGFDDESMTYDFDSAFPIERAPDLITNGFVCLRDKTLFCLLMAIGCRLHEALLLTWDDINPDPNNRIIKLVAPKGRRGKKLGDFLGYLTLEQQKELPWKGRAHPYTCQIEPFASEFWRLLEMYMSEEMVFTQQHPFIFQVVKDPKKDNNGRPLILSDHSNLRKSFKAACARIGVDSVWGPHSLRHMYGVYGLNYWPRSNGEFGLPIDVVQQLMGHANQNSTKAYAVPDMFLLQAEQRTNIAYLAGFGVESRDEVRLKILDQMRNEALNQIKTHKRIQCAA